MRLEPIDGGFVEVIENGIVEKIFCMYDGICTVYFYDKPPKKLNVDCSSYNKQYGIPVSKDGQKLFFSSWEEGLFAYDIFSGTILWKMKGTKITSIIVHDTYIITKKYCASIIKLDIDSGEVLAEIKSGTIERDFDLGGSYILVDSIKGKLSVIDTEKMLVVKKYNPKIVNPSNSLSVSIHDATLQGNTLTISGAEEVQTSRTYNETNYKAFNRVIDTDFCVM